MKTAPSATALTGISQTALWTLRSRADEHMRTDRLFADPQATAWYAELSNIDGPVDWYTPALQTTIAIRTQLYDDVITRFLASHESPVIVELGAGFSTLYARLGSALSKLGHWLEIDLPKLIAIRRQLEDEHNTHRLI